MPTYEQIPTDDIRDTSVCDDCGAVIYNQTQHSKYHETLSTVAANARKADLFTSRIR